MSLSSLRSYWILLTFKRTTKWNLKKHKYKTKKKFKGYTDINALLITFLVRFATLILIIGFVLNKISNMINTTQSFKEGHADLS